MEKISGIIPSSPRVSAVDLRESSPVRPGTPTFGRPEGVSSLRDAKLGETARKSVALHNELSSWRSKESQQAAIAKEMSERFFAKSRPKEEEAPMSREIDLGPVMEFNSTPRASVPAGFKTDESGSFTAASRALAPISAYDVADEQEEFLEQPEGLYPKGSFIDRTA